VSERASSWKTRRSSRGPRFATLLGICAIYGYRSCRWTGLKLLRVRKISNGVIRPSYSNLK
jgi:hypothetical protein